MVLGILRPRLKKVWNVLSGKDKEGAKKVNLFLGGFLAGMITMFSMILIILYNTIGFTPTFYIPKTGQTNADLNFLDMYQLFYYKGVLDTLYFQYSNTFICRYDNLNEAMQFIAKNNAFNNSVIYLLLDQNHIRAAVWYNNTSLYVFDVTYPTYRFSPSDSEIFQCVLSPEPHYGINCTIIYYLGSYRLLMPQDEYVISRLLGINLS